MDDLVRGPNLRVFFGQNLDTTTGQAFWKIAGIFFFLTFGKSILEPHGLNYPGGFCEWCNTQARLVRVQHIFGGECWRIRKSCLRWRVPLRPFQQSSHLVWTVSPMKFPSLKRLFQDYSRSNFECCTYIREHDNQIHAKMYSHDLLTCKYIHAVSTIHKLCSSARVIETKTYKNQFSSKNIKTRECATCQNTGCLCAMVRFCIQKMLCIIYGIFYIHAPG